MVERKVESWFDGEPIDLQRSWRPWNEISDDLKVAVIAGDRKQYLTLPQTAITYGLTV